MFCARYTEVRDGARFQRANLTPVSMVSKLPRDWLLLRGLGRESGHWEPFEKARTQASLLRTRMRDGSSGTRALTAGMVPVFPTQIFEDALPRGSRVHTLDNPGVGSASEEVVPLTLRATTAQLLRKWSARREAAGIPKDAPWAVLGNSMGGMLALDIASQDAAARSGLVAAVVVNSSGAKGTSTWRRLTPRAAFTMLRCLFVPSRVRETVMLKMTVRDPRRAAELLPRWVALAKANPLSLRTFFSQLFAVARWTAPTSVAVPVLVVSGLGDELCHPECSVALARSLQAPLRMHPTAGHDLPAEDPAWLAGTVREWLDQGCQSEHR